MRTTISPSACFADAGVSIKVFMPPLDDKLLVLNCKVFGLGKFTGFHSDGFSQHNSITDDENGLSLAAQDVHMNRRVVIAVEKESEAVFDENRRHVQGVSLLMGASFHGGPVGPPCGRELQAVIDRLYRSSRGEAGVL